MPDNAPGDRAENRIESKQEMVNTSHTEAVQKQPCALLRHLQTYLALIILIHFFSSKVNIPLHHAVLLLHMKDLGAGDSGKEGMQLYKGGAHFKESWVCRAGG